MPKLILSGTLQLSAPAIITGSMAAGYGGSHVFSASNSSWPLLQWGDVGHSGVLTDYTGPSTLTTTQTIQNKRITGTLTQSENYSTTVTVLNCHFDGYGPDYGYNNRYNKSHSNHVIFEDCTFTGHRRCSALGAGTGMTFRRCQWRGAKADFFKAYGTGDFLFEDCYFGGLSRPNAPGEDIHSDLQQSEANPGSTITYKRCTFDTPNIYAANIGRKVFIEPGTWLYDEGSAAGLSGTDLYYRCTQGIFFNGGVGGTCLIENCHWYRCGSRALRIAGTSVTADITLRDNLFYPEFMYEIISGTGSGSLSKQGDNLWAVSGTDAKGVFRTAGTPAI